MLNNAKHANIAKKCKKNAQTNKQIIQKCIKGQNLKTLNIQLGNHAIM